MVIKQDLTITEVGIDIIEQFFYAVLGHFTNMNIKYSPKSIFFGLYLQDLKDLANFR